MRKIIVTVLILVLLLPIMSVVSYAGTWSSGNVTNNYVPPKGNSSTICNSSATFSSTTATTEVTFKMSTTNLNLIRDYNIGSILQGHFLFFGIDTKNYRNGTVDKMHASLKDKVYTNLPNPKKDVEDDNFDGKNEEAEVVARDTMNSTTVYYS